MKNLFFLFSISILFFSCSNFENSTAPVFPETFVEKSNPSGFPYDYLESFQSVNANWETTGGIGYITVSLVNDALPYQQVFAVVTHNSFQADKVSNTLVYLQKPEDNKFAFSFLADEIADVRIYGTTKLAGSTGGATDPVFPYPYQQNFYEVDVADWSVNDGNIIVEASGMPVHIDQMFTELQTKSGNFLLFIGKPDSEKFEIPKYGDKGVYDVNLFGLWDELDASGIAVK